MCAVGGSRRSTESIDALFPDPDSPTIPTISPRSTSRFIPRTASTEFGPFPNET